MRTPNANDVDLVAAISESDFDRFLIDRFDNAVTKNDIPINLTNKSKQELLAIAEDCNLNPKLYNNQCKSFSKAFVERKISAYSKDKIIPRFRELYKKVSTSYPELNIENITIQTSGGKFDLTPYLKL